MLRKACFFTKLFSNAPLRKYGSLKIKSQVDTPCTSWRLFALKVPHETLQWLILKASATVSVLMISVFLTNIHSVKKAMFLHCLKNFIAAPKLQSIVGLEMVAEMAHVAFSDQLRYYHWKATHCLKPKTDMIVIWWIYFYQKILGKIWQRWKAQEACKSFRAFLIPHLLFALECSYRTILFESYFNFQHSFRYSLLLESSK